MKLLVGLGNPGTKYARTRHNLGWLALQEILRRPGDPGGPPPGMEKFHGLFGDGRIDGGKILWLFPETYMNRAGRSVAAAARFFKLEPESVVVFHDDLELAPGKIRMKRGGGNAGHNGLKSIQQDLGSGDFIRIRLGIGRPPSYMDPANYVLAPFAPEEFTRIEPLLTALPAVMPLVLAGNLGAAMNRLMNPPSANREKRPRPPDRPPA